MARRLDSRPCLCRGSDSRRGPSSPQGRHHCSTGASGYAGGTRFRTSASTSVGWTGRILLARMGAWPGPGKRLRSTALRSAGSATAFAAQTSTRLVVVHRTSRAGEKHADIATLGSAIATEHSQRERLLLCSGLNEHALLAFKHPANCRSLEHPILVLGVILELTHRQLATQAPTIEHQRVRIAN